MSFLPIVDRELRIGSRHPATYRLRWMFVGAVMVIWFVLLASGNRFASPAQRGRTLFAAVGIPAFLFALFSGVFLTADCVSQERRDGTLGLLFLTNLKGYDVIIGKLVATSLHAFYGLLAILPLLSLPLLMGGVSAGQFWRVTLALIVIMLLSLSLGMLVSSVSRKTRTSLSSALLLLIVIAGIPPAIWALGKSFGFGTFPDKLLLLSPGYLYGQAQDAYVGMALRVSRFYISLKLTIGLTLLCLIGATAFIRHAWRDKEERSSAKDTRGGRSSWRFVSRSDARITNEPNPCYWLFYRDRQAEWITTIIVPVLFIAWLCCIPGTFSSRWSVKSPSFSLLMFIAFGSHFLLKLYIAIEASRRLNEDRRSGALELLLSTPLTVHEITSAQLRALRDMFTRPIVTLTCLNLGMVALLVMANPMSFRNEDRTVFVEGYFAGLLLLFLDARAICWTGVLMGFRNRKHHWAVFKTLGVLVIFPWLCVFVLAMSTRGGSSSGEVTGWATTYYILAAGYDLLIAKGAQQSLANELRESNSQFSPAVGAPLP